MILTRTKEHLKHPPVLELQQTLRRQLIAAMGMRYDPFKTSVSESESAPDFGEIYVDPRPSLLDPLKQPKSTLVFADYGMGKTATRLALEYTLRNSYEAHPPLCVTYTPRGIQPGSVGAGRALSHHLSAISAEAAIDLVVQLLERQHKNALLLTDEQRAALDRQALALPINLRRRVRDTAAATSEDLKDGVIWREVRLIARHVAVTPQWRAWIDRIAAIPAADAPQPVAWEQTLADVRVLGFPRIFLLIDAVDEGAIEREVLHATIAPLLDHIALLHAQNVLLKCFLPADLLEVFEIHYRTQFQGLTVPVEIATIAEVPPDHLKAIVNERLQAASLSNASFQSLDWFKGPEIGASIQDRLARLAQGSPRRMIELSSELLDFHSRHGFRMDKRLWLTTGEWQAFLEWIERLSLASP